MARPYYPDIRRYYLTHIKDIAMTSYTCQAAADDYATARPIYDRNHEDWVAEIDVYEKSSTGDDRLAKVVLSRADALDLATRLINRVLHGTWEGASNAKE